MPPVLRHAFEPPPSTQVYHWPRAFEAAARWTPWIAGALLVAGFLLFVASNGLDDGLEQATAGILMCVAGSAALAKVAILHLCVARRVAFTRDRVVVWQTLRQPLLLSYAGYQHDWVVDSTNPRALRLLLFRDNRGCTVWDPPEWVAGAFAEIARIAREEGWYEPEES